MEIYVARLGVVVDDRRLRVAGAEALATRRNGRRVGQGAGAQTPVSSGMMPPNTGR